MAFWTPARRRGVELLDDPKTTDDDRAAAMRDLARSNALFGGTFAVRHALRDALPTIRRDALLLDVGTGMGDIPRALAESEHLRESIRTIGVDFSPFQIKLARPFVDFGVAGDALRLPFADDVADVVICSQLLHHFFDGDPKRLIGELHRVSRDWVVISDLRRSLLAAGGFAVAGALLGFHHVTVLDGGTSIMRGFTAGELGGLIEAATGVRPTVRRSRFWRLTATWRKYH